MRRSAEQIAELVRLLPGHHQGPFVTSLFEHLEHSAVAAVASAERLDQLGAVAL